MSVPAVASFTRQKALGAFYTPAPMAEKMVRWALREPSDCALDPSFGGLVFLQAAHARLTELGAPPQQAAMQLFGCDLDEDAHAATAAHAALGMSEDALLHRDFFDVVPGPDLPLVQAAVGNPPYVRYQGFNSAASAAHRLAREAGVPLTRLSSSWAPFVLHSTSFVAPGGRLALVLPAELLHAQYAAGVLSYVQRHFARTALVVFEQRVFPGALEEVVLLFAEGRSEGESAGPTLVECDTLDDLDIDDLTKRMKAVSPSAGRRGQGKLLTQLLSADTRGLYQQLAADSRVQALGSIASVDIGAVTGANDYFLLDAGEAAAMPAELLRPAVSKAVHIAGARFDAADLDLLRARGARTELFVARGSADELPASVAAYLRRGKKRGIHERYKARVRSPWWAVPLPKHGTPDLLLTYCASEHPRLVLNEAQALHTNTLHGVVVADDAGIAPAALAAGFVNSLSLLSAELVGRSYGGGVLKLEPSEAEAVLVPPLPSAVVDHLPAVDEALRARDLGAALDIIDPLVLGDGLGLDEDEIAGLRAGAERLRSRRRARGKAPR